MRKILVHGDKIFVLGLPDDVKLTFGPFSPPTKKQEYHNDRASTLLRGTLRVYRGAATTQNILAIYTGVESFRDLDITYAEYPDLPICSFCKENEVMPGEDLCPPCLGQKDEIELVRARF
jgi:hypothetical protein